MGCKYSYPTYNPLITTHEPPSKFRISDSFCPRKYTTKCRYVILGRGLELADKRPGLEIDHFGRNLCYTHDLPRFREGLRLEASVLRSVWSYCASAVKAMS